MKSTFSVYTSNIKIKQVIHLLYVYVHTGFRYVILKTTVRNIHMNHQVTNFTQTTESVLRKKKR